MPSLGRTDRRNAGASADVDIVNVVRGVIYCSFQLVRALIDSSAAICGGRVDFSCAPRTTVLCGASPVAKNYLGSLRISIEPLEYRESSAPSCFRF